jgi:cytochrome P450
VLGALFAGQLNSGINAAWMLLYLADNDHWHELVREEVESAANRHCTDTSLPLVDRLMQVPMEAWESEFPTIDLILKESIRLQLPGAAFRKNLSGQPIPVNKEGTEVIPADGYATLPTSTEIPTHTPIPTVSTRRDTCPAAQKTRTSNTAGSDGASADTLVLA